MAPISGLRNPSPKPGDVPRPTDNQPSGEGVPLLNEPQARLPTGLQQGKDGTTRLPKPPARAQQSISIATGPRADALSRPFAAKSTPKISKKPAAVEIQEIRRRRPGAGFLATAGYALGGAVLVGAPCAAVGALFGGPIGMMVLGSVGLIIGGVLAGYYGNKRDASSGPMGGPLDATDWGTPEGNAKPKPSATVPAQIQIEEDDDSDIDNPFVEVEERTPEESPTADNRTRRQRERDSLDLRNPSSPRDDDQNPGPPVAGPSAQTR